MPMGQNVYSKNALQLPYSRKNRLSLKALNRTMAPIAVTTSPMFRITFALPSETFGVRVMLLLRFLL